MFQKNTSLQHGSGNDPPEAPLSFCQTLHLLKPCCVPAELFGESGENEHREPAETVVPALRLPRRAFRTPVFGRDPEDAAAGLLVPATTGTRRSLLSPPQFPRAAARSPRASGVACNVRPQRRPSGRGLPRLESAGAPLRLGSAGAGGWEAAADGRASAAGAAGGGGSAAGAAAAATATATRTSGARDGVLSSPDVFASCDRLPADPSPPLVASPPPLPAAPLERSAAKKAFLPAAAEAPGLPAAPLRKVSGGSGAASRHPVDAGDGGDGGDGGDARAAAAAAAAASRAAAAAEALPRLRALHAEVVRLIRAEHPLAAHSQLKELSGGIQTLAQKLRVAVFGLLFPPAQGAPGDLADWLLRTPEEAARLLKSMGAAEVAPAAAEQQLAAPATAARLLAAACAPVAWPSAAAGCGGGVAGLPVLTEKLTVLPNPGEAAAAGSRLDELLAAAEPPAQQELVGRARLSCRAFALRDLPVVPFTVEEGAVKPPRATDDDRSANSLDFAFNPATRESGGLLLPVAVHVVAAAAGAPAAPGELPSLADDIVISPAEEAAVNELLSLVSSTVNNAQIHRMRIVFDETRTAMTILRRDFSVDPTWSKHKAKDQTICWKVFDNGNAFAIIEGSIECEILQLVACLNEADLHKNWIPFLGGCGRMHQISKFTQIIKLLSTLPWPLDDRETVMLGYAVDRLSDPQRPAIIMNGGSLPDRATSYFGLPLRPPQDGLTRIQLKYFTFELCPHRDDPRRLTSRFIVYMNPRMDFIPKTVQGFVARTAAAKLYDNLKKLSKNFATGPYAARVKKNLFMYGEVQQRVDAFFRPSQQAQARARQTSQPNTRPTGKAR